MEKDSTKAEVTAVENTKIPDKNQSSNDTGSGSSTDSKKENKSIISAWKSKILTGNESTASDGTLPKTGKEQRIVYYLAGIAFFAAGIYVLVYKDKRKHEKKKKK